jgi:uncharacterized small protein (DUF1192 family)
MVWIPSNHSSRETDSGPPAFGHLHAPNSGFYEVTIAAPVAPKEIGQVFPRNAPAAPCGFRCATYDIDQIEHGFTRFRAVQRHRQNPTEYGPEVTAMENTLSLSELNDRIAILRDNIRQLVEQAAGSSGAGDEERTADRIAQQTAELDRLVLQRDAIAKN